MPKVAVIRFPGTNADLDVLWVLREVSKVEAHLVWYKDFRCCEWDAIVLPGGFSYGDWLRAGAIAANTDAMNEVIKSIDNNIPVLGICNGFQILTEAGVLPGSLLSNESGKFMCKWVKIRIERPRGPWLKLASDGLVIDMPIAHSEGRYYISPEVYSNTLARTPLIRYHGVNPNGSMYDIAGVASPDGLVLGLMPHPERAAEDIITPKGYIAGGRVIWLSIASALREGW